MADSESNKYGRSNRLKEVAKPAHNAERNLLSSSNGYNGEEPAPDAAHSPLSARKIETGTGKALDPDAIWRQLKSEFAMQHSPGSSESWVQDTWLIAYEDGEFIVGLPDAFRLDWIEKKMRPQIKRKLMSLTGKSLVNVRFCVQPRPVADHVDGGPAPLYETTGLAGVPAPAQPAPLPGGSAPDKPAVANGHVPSARINPKHTFDSMVVGSHNKLAHAVAEAITERPGAVYNPVFVYGGVGLGKTHLLHAIGNRLQENGARVLYCTAEEFTNDLISAIRSHTTDLLRAKYREVDALLIDDIQFIEGKESTQEEFFHTFNHLHAAGKQIVISSDRQPKALATLEGRLRSRFEGGIQTDIQAPDFETRVAILESKCRRQGMHVSVDVLMLIAERVDSNVRELEGVLNNLWMQAHLQHSALTLPVASSLLNNLAPRRTPSTPARVLQLAAEYFAMPADELTGRRRTADVVYARHVVMYLLREENGLSLPAIGDILGGRDHTTVRHGIEKITKDLESEEAVRRDVMILRERMYLPFVSQ